MHSLLNRVDTFQGVQKHTDHGLPYRFETIFKDESRKDRRASKKKLKLLRRIDTELRPMLQEGEEVRFLTHGTSYTLLESYFMGWLLYYFNKRAIVLTDRRILLLQIHGGDRPGVLRSQVRYSGITRVKRSLFGNTVLKLQNGKKLTFTRVPKGDAKFLRSLIERLQEAGVTEGAPVTGHEHLCPHCYAVAEIGQVECDACGGTFKSPRKAGLLSLLFPGIGDFYMGHRKLAALEFIVVAVAWIVFLTPSPEYPMTAIGAAFTAAALVLFLHVPDAVGTWFLARRGVFPEEAGPGGPVREPAVGLGLRMDEGIPSRRTLRTRVREGVSLEEIQSHLRAQGMDREASLKMVSTLPVRSLSSSEKVLQFGIAFSWIILALLYTIGVLDQMDQTGTSEAVLSTIMFWLIGGQIVQLKGSAYGWGALWLVVSYIWGIWEMLTAPAPGDEWIIGIFGVLFCGTAVAMLFLQRRLFPHVSTWGRHRKSTERRIVQV